MRVGNLCEMSPVAARCRMRCSVRGRLAWPLATVCGGFGWAPIAHLLHCCVRRNRAILLCVLIIPQLVLRLHVERAESSRVLHSLFPSIERALVGGWLCQVAACVALAVHAQLQCMTPDIEAGRLPHVGASVHTARQDFYSIRGSAWSRARGVS